MVCSACGTNNEKGFKFCVKCGNNLDNSSEPNYEQVDMGKYHSEEEFSGGNGGFTMNEGTFVIRDVAPVPEKKLYTADELNRSEEDFDFSIYDDVPTADEKNAAPTQPVSDVQTIPTNMQQPVMHGQPHIIGYNQNGQPVYGQPAMHGQPRIIGYDQNGQPVYGKTVPVPATNSRTPVQTSPPAPQTAPSAQPAPPKQSFWDFFNDGEKKEEPKKSETDFFGRIKDTAIDPSDPFADIDNRRKKRLSEANKAAGIMSDVPIIDGSTLEKIDSGSMNSIFMRKINDTASNDLAGNSGTHIKPSISGANEIDASNIPTGHSFTEKTFMKPTVAVNADDIEADSFKHREAIMAEPDHAVDPLPKKAPVYVDELDKIELPEYMQAWKTPHDETKKIPTLPEI